MRYTWLCFLVVLIAACGASESEPVEKLAKSEEDSETVPVTPSVALTQSTTTQPDDTNPDADGDGIRDDYDPGLSDNDDHDSGLSEMESMTELLIPVTGEGDDWMFDTDSDATLQMTWCVSWYYIETLGISTAEIRELFLTTTNAGRQSALEALVLVKQSQIEGSIMAAFRILDCFQQNAQPEDYVKFVLAKVGTPG